MNAIEARQDYDFLPPSLVCGLAVEGFSAKRELNRLDTPRYPPSLQSRLFLRPRGRRKREEEGQYARRFMILAAVGIPIPSPAPNPMPLAALNECRYTRKHRTWDVSGVESRVKTVSRFDKMSARDGSRWLSRF